MEQQILKRIDAKLSKMAASKSKEPETWVKSTVIIQLTGWDGEKLRGARRNAYITWKKNDTGFWYLLQSLDPIFYKK